MESFLNTIHTSLIKTVFPEIKCITLGMSVRKEEREEREIGEIERGERDRRERERGACMADQ